MLVGLETGDDAGVYLLNEETVLIQTVDFFTPIVDDPYIFGAVAAANALSDIYAMGGKPVTAMNIMAFPMETLPSEVLAEILKGGADKVKEAGALLMGGHSIKDDEPKYGLAVTGIASPQEVWTNAGAKEGDMLVLTKPLGIGIITSALRKKRNADGSIDLRTVVRADIEKAAVEVMMELNDKAARAGRSVGINACTDITGFGLLGHAWEMAKASQVGMEIEFARIPVLDGARELGLKGYIAGGNRANLKYMIDKVDYPEGIEDIVKFILADPITSGGLLMSVSPDKLERLLEALKEEGVVNASLIGRVVPGKPIIKVKE